MIYNWHTTSPRVQFTYGQPTSHYRSPHMELPSRDFVPLSGTSSFQPYQPRSASLPHQNAHSLPQYESHIKIMEGPSESEKQRKHRIFEETPNMNGQNMSGKTKTRSKKIFEEYRPSLDKRVEKRLGMTEKEEQKKDRNVIKVDSAELDRRIDDRLIEKLSQLQQSRRHLTIPSSQIKRKEQEITCLKLEVQRLKRCDRLNKENESLYKRLVDKLKEKTGYTGFEQRSRKRQSWQRSPKAHFHRQTPINSLTDLRKGDQETTVNHHRTKQEIIINAKATRAETEPLKQGFEQVNARKNQGQSLKDNKAYQQGEQRTVTFNGEERSSHAKRVKGNEYTNYGRVQKQMDCYLQNKQIVWETPITQRLEEINRQLERSMYYNGRRSSSKPKVKGDRNVKTIFANTAGSGYYGGRSKQRMSMYDYF